MVGDRWSVQEMITMLIRHGMAHLMASRARERVPPHATACPIAASAAHQVASPPHPLRKQLHRRVSASTAPDEGGRWFWRSVLDERCRGR